MHSGAHIDIHEFIVLWNGCTCRSDNSLVSDGPMADYQSVNLTPKVLLHGIAKLLFNSEWFSEIQDIYNVVVYAILRLASIIYSRVKLGSVFQKHNQLTNASLNQFTAH